MDGGHKVNASFPDKLSKVTEYIVPYFQTGIMVQSIKHKLTTTMLKISLKIFLSFEVFACGNEFSSSQTVLQGEANS